jgi:hypothetical protein
VKERSEVVAVDLTVRELDLLLSGLHEWSGPASCTASLARGMGFDDVDDFDQERERMGLALRTGAALSRWDWTRILIASEIAFVSDVVGSGVEWPTTTGQTDADTLAALRGLQRSSDRCGSHWGYEVAKNAEPAIEDGRG